MFRLVAIICLATSVAAIGAPVEFEKDVQPILTKHCGKCHGEKKRKSGLRVDDRANLLAGGDSGEPAIVVGKGSGSYLIKIVSGKDPELMMPPKGKGDPLTAAQIDVLRAWIDQGAKWSLDDVSTEKALTTDHWSFQPIRDPSAPRIKSKWIINPIDAFVLAKLLAAELRPSAPADRVALIRRLYLDMHGLPPTPEAIEQFEKGGDYQELVEGVLASPRYGERWARHWLDVVRFAESAGFETNHERPNAYHYRDYVIRAFNEDKPYDRFVFEQIAGDAVGEDAATGFIVGGAFDRVKGKDPLLNKMQRQDELADIINTTGTTFLGLTVGCARCHNHKFDPILQKDYYAMGAVFAGVEHGERAMRSADDEARKEKAEEIAKQIAALRAELDELSPPPVATGASVVIDDEALDHVALLGKKNGHGTNPAGVEPGYKDDPGEAGVRLPNISGGRYTWWTNHKDQDVFTYRPRAAGRFRVWLSWGAGWNTHTQDARYLLDIDGNVSTKGDQRKIATIDQQLLANGAGKVVSKPLWSGFQNVGVHEFEPNSSIVLRGGEHGTAITADIVVLERVDGTETAVPAQPALREKVNPERNVERFAPVVAKFIRFTSMAATSAEPCIDELEIYSTDQNVALGGKPTSSGNYKGNPKHKLEHINDGRYGNERSWISNENGKGWVQIELAKPTRIDRIVWGRDRNKRYRDRLATKYVIEASVRDGEWMTVAGSADRIPFDSKVNADGFRYATLSGEKAKRASAILAKIKPLEKQRATLMAPPTVYAGRFVTPPTTHRLYRGDPLSPREAVAPDALTVMHKPAAGRAPGSLKLAMGAGDVDRRVALAKWIISKDNPLTARVVVNRIWHYHFGRGIVATPSDFGAMGFKPTHPVLLDWLASEFVRSGYSIKHMHRLIVMSNTYRQASKISNLRFQETDAEAILLWRFPSRRLEAETIRDSILAVSGNLDLRMGGPGFMLFQPNANYARNWVAKDEFGPSEFRRMIYALKIRMEHDSVFGVFDCPDGGQICANRSRSTTPIQALNLFNSRFMMQQSEALAKRVVSEAGTNPADQVSRVFMLAFGRRPDEGEVKESIGFVKEYGLPAMCRAMLNASEFLFLP